MLLAWLGPRFLLSTTEAIMVTLERSLVYASGDSDVEIRINVHAPIRGKRDWQCAYEIAWPDGSRRGFGYGVDSAQAMLLALHAIGTDIYTSDYHRSGRLSWERPGRGYGFPVPRTIRNLLIGDDAQNFG